MDYLLEQVNLNVDAQAPQPTVTTIGGGDALFSAFLHSYVTTHDPYRALQKAVLFAGYKIGSVGAADGFLTASELDVAYARYYKSSED